MLTVVWANDSKLLLLLIIVQKIKYPNLKSYHSLVYDIIKCQEIDCSPNFTIKNQYTLTICPLRTVRAFELFTDLRKDRAHYNDIEKSNHYYFIVFSHQKAKT